MVKIKNIARLWNFSAKEEGNSALVPEFKSLAEMRRYVPYLKDFKFHQTSLQSGDSKSSFKGRGMEFEEVRVYNYGDDVRDIDWRVTARKNVPYTKIYAEEKDREVFVWFSMAEDMRFGTKRELKSVTAAKTAALLSWFALGNKDRLNIVVFDGLKTRVFEIGRKQENMLTIFKKIEQISRENLSLHQDEESMAKSLQLLQKKINHKSIVFLVGSFGNMDEKTKREISSLSKSNEAYLIHVYDALEAYAPPQGEYLAQHGKESFLLKVAGRDFSEVYADYFAKQRKDVQDFCLKFGCRYREIRTDLEIYKQLRPI